MMNANPGTQHWTWIHTLLVVVFSLAIIGAGASAFFMSRPLGILPTWWLIAGLLTLLTLTIGHGLDGRWLGALIDDRNRMSLSRLQLIVWTIVILSAFLSAAFWNIAAGKDDPLGIAVPAEIWTLLGISTTSLAASPLIRSGKKGNPPNKEEAARSIITMSYQRAPRLNLAPNLSALGLPAAHPLAEANPKPAHESPQVINQGQVIAFTTPEAASPADMFQGEEVGNADRLDVGKMQMFYFTLILVVAYTYNLYKIFAAASGKIDAFPTLDPSMIVLLGISHAGYLANKAVPQSAPPDRNA